MTIFQWCQLWSASMIKMEVVSTNWGHQLLKTSWNLLAPNFLQCLEIRSRATNMKKKSFKRIMLSKWRRRKRTISKKTIIFQMEKTMKKNNQRKQITVYPFNSILADLVKFKMQKQAQWKEAVKHQHKQRPVLTLVNYLRRKWRNQIYPKLSLRGEISSWWLSFLKRHQR